jgi:hypothetical protein
MGGNENAVNLSRHRGEAGIGPRGFELGRIRIDGDDLMSTLSKMTEDGIGGCAACARDAGYNDALTRDEIGNARWKFVHGCEDL